MERSEDGINYHYCKVLPTDSLSYTDDSANVNKQSYNYIVRGMDSCGDIGLVSNIGKTIYLQIDTTGLYMEPGLLWNNYIFWTQGVKDYSVMQENASGNFNSMLMTLDTSYVDTGTNLNSLPYYCYEIIAHSNVIYDSTGTNDSALSYSNIACVYGEHSYIYIPNAFTPNSDGINDRFGAQGLYITEIAMRIYDRWGELVFSSNSIFDTWDGKFNGKACEAGTYIWTANVRGLDNKLRYLSGDVNLLK